MCQHDNIIHMIITPTGKNNETKQYKEIITL